ncbi:unnamed protein product [Caenorhabditis auriculariae]|uniref:Uncharacterized protein n=1 Tax=Caenorhabditis auriculariae TaxID=2777116 RepID=A0A8S1H5R5_9PELO|nr:unnamed protein product [Caenorhabditis auriculariae]
MGTLLSSLHGAAPDPSKIGRFVTSFHVLFIFSRSRKPNTNMAMSRSSKKPRPTIPWRLRPFSFRMAAAQEFVAWWLTSTEQRN